MTFHDPALRAAMETRAKVQDALRSGPKSMRELQAITGLPETTVRGALRNLINLGQAVTMYGLKRRPRCGRIGSSAD